MNQLHLYESIMLLALRDKKGTTHFGINYEHAMAGAVIAELLLNKKIIVEASGKKKFVKLNNLKNTGDPILDECLFKIKNAKRRARIETWVGRFTGLRRFKHRTAENLCKKGILKYEEEKVLLLFTRKIYPEINPKPEQAILSKLEEAIFSEKNELDPETIVLLALCEATGMLKPLFDKKKLRQRKKRIKEITSGNMVGKATREAVEAMQAAVAVAAVIPAIAVAATSS